MRIKSTSLLLPGILAIATTLRVSFTGIAPLLDMIRANFSLSTAQTGILTTLPLLAFAIISPLVASIAHRTGTERALFGAMLLICLGIILRSSGNIYFLYAGTAIIGCGIAMGNVLLPGLIKRDFPEQVARLTGAYSLTMGIAAAIGSVMVVPVAFHGFGWQGALITLIIFPLIALLIWLPQLSRHKAANLANDAPLNNRGIWRSSLAWHVTLFLGINSLIYYVIVGWLPSILISHGYSEAQAGSLHGLLQLATAIPGLFIGTLVNRLRDQRGIAVLVALLCAISSAGLLIAPAFATFWVLIFGFGCGATMILGLIFIGLRSGSAHQAAALSGMAQSIGYLLAAFGPPLMGKIHDTFQGWSLPLLSCTLLSIIMATFGALAGRNTAINVTPKISSDIKM